jgi:AraC-like DNA-binding protein
MTRAQRDFEKICRDVEEIVFERQETGRAHNSYEQELREQKSIEDGDLESLEKSIAELDWGGAGKLAEDPLRQMQDMGIVVVTLASRSAIRGGVSAEFMFSLSDSAIQNIEKITYPDEIVPLVREFERHCARLVRQEQDQAAGRREDSNPIVRACKNYLFSHLHEKLTVAGIAEAIHVSPNYLSSVFRKQEGMTLSRYIRFEKIHRARNMLLYSDISCGDIAQYLGFSSQSHLGACFREATGMTLSDYRRRYTRDRSWE